MPKSIAAYRKFFAIPGLAVLLGGCGGSSSNAPASSALSASTKTASGLALTLSENTSVIPVGGNVAYTLMLTNTTLHPVTVYLRSGCHENVRTKTFSGIVQFYSPAHQYLNIVVCDAEGEMGPTTLAPGQSVTGALNSSDADTDGAFSTPGTYTVQGYVSFTALSGGLLDQVFTPSLPVTVR